MAEVSTRDGKIIQYLNEAYGKEKQLETALQAHIQMTSRAPYKRRLQRHLRETKDHARQLERRIKKLGGVAEALDLPGPEAVADAAQAVQNVANRAAALAQGPLHALRGTSDEEKLLKNAKTQFQDEAEEIATYTAVEALADNVGDKETARLAKKIRREEERMRDFLAKLIPQLTKAVVQREIPAEERAQAGGRRSGTRARRGSASASSSTRARSRASSSRSSSSRSSTSRSSSRSGSSRSGSSRGGSSGSSRGGSSGSSRGGSSGSSRGGSSRTSSSRSGSSGGSRSTRSTGSSRSSGSSRTSGASRSSGSRSSSGSSRGRSSGGSGSRSRS